MLVFLSVQLVLVILHRIHITAASRQALSVLYLYVSNIINFIPTLLSLFYYIQYVIFHSIHAVRNTATLKTAYNGFI